MQPADLLKNSPVLDTEKAKLFRKLTQEEHRINQRAAAELLKRIEAKIKDNQEVETLYFKRRPFEGEYPKADIYTVTKMVNKVYTCFIVDIDGVPSIVVNPKKPLQNEQMS